LTTIEKLLWMSLTMAKITKEAMDWWAQIPCDIRDHIIIEEYKKTRCPKCGTPFKGLMCTCGPMCAECGYSQCGGAKNFKKIKKKILDDLKKMDDKNRKKDIMKKSREVKKAIKKSMAIQKDASEKFDKAHAEAMKTF